MSSASSPSQTEQLRLGDLPDPELLGHRDRSTFLEVGNGGRIKTHRCPICHERREEWGDDDRDTCFSTHLAREDHTFAALVGEESTDSYTRAP